MSSRTRGVHVVDPVTLSGETPPGRTYREIVAVDESGQDSSNTPTVVTAVYVSRDDAERLALKLCENGIFPWKQKSKDVSGNTISKFFTNVSVSRSGMASRANPGPSQRAVMAFECIKEVITDHRSETADQANCLVLLDGRPSNYGGEKALLNCRKEIVDDYFQSKYNLDVEIATLETADKRYPEITVADCACREYIDAVGREGYVEAVDGLSRLDSKRSVPSVDADGRVNQLAGEGTSAVDTVAARVVAWATGSRPAEQQIGERDRHLARALDDKLSNDELTAKILSEGNQPGSQQA